MSTVPRVLMTTWRRRGQTFGPVLRDMYGAEVQYVHAVQRAGAQVFLAPADDISKEPVDGVMAGFDGLLLIGGEDLAAEVSGCSPTDVGENASAARDRWEISLLMAALQVDRPVLAICRGLQLLNVGRGGTLHGDIAGNSAQHQAVPEDLEDALAFRHGVEFDPGSLAARVYGVTAKEVNSLHHQAVDRLGDGLVVSGRAADGHIEAIELPEALWCLAVQWHPELLPDDPLERRLLTAFVASCRVRRP